MNTRTASRAAALFLSALFTVATMAGVERLATTQHAAAQLAKCGAATQRA